MLRCNARNLVLNGFAILALLGHGQTAEAEASRPINNVRSFFALPMELDLDSGAANGDAKILRIMPLYTFPVLDRWKLIHLDIITLADAPGGTPAFPGDPVAGQTAGLSDLLHSSFFTPKDSRSSS